MNVWFYCQDLLFIFWILDYTSPLYSEKKENKTKKADQVNMTEYCYVAETIDEPNPFFAHLLLCHAIRLFNLIQSQT